MARVRQHIPPQSDIGHTTDFTREASDRWMERKC